MYDNRVDAAVDGGESFPGRLGVVVAVAGSLSLIVEKVVVELLRSNAVSDLLFDLFGKTGQGGIGGKIAVRYLERCEGRDATHDSSEELTEVHLSAHGRGIDPDA